MAALAHVAGSSAVPNTFTQQGRLFDRATAEPVSGTVTLTFTIYDHQTESDSPLWSETQTISLDDGYFSALLGDDTPIDVTIFDGSVRYLGVKVGTDDEMTPRQTITSVPYALRSATAGHAVTADTATTAGNVPFTGLTSIPSPCSPGSFLRGYNASGTPQCGSPSMSCETFSSAITTNADNVFHVHYCDSGYAVTGGGCHSGGTNLGIRRSNPVSGQGWACYTVGNALGVDLTAYARCCRVQ